MKIPKMMALVRRHLRRIRCLARISSRVSRSGADSRAVQRLLQLGDDARPLVLISGFFEAVGEAKNEHGVVRVPVALERLVIDPLGNPTLGFSGAGDQFEVLVERWDYDL